MSVEGLDSKVLEEVGRLGRDGILKLERLHTVPWRHWRSKLDEIEGNDGSNRIELAARACEGKRQL